MSDRKPKQQDGGELTGNVLSILLCDGRAPHPLCLLAVAAEPVFADDVDVDALLGQKRFQFVDANVRCSIQINGDGIPFLVPAEQSQGTDPGSEERQGGGSIDLRACKIDSICKCTVTGRQGT